MSYKFERPVGAAADARELEYIAALHQTTDDEDESWMDGSIEATDVRNFLKSRYGINVTKQEVRDLIFAEMGGSDHEDECIDLTEGEYKSVMKKNESIHGDSYEVISRYGRI